MLISVLCTGSRKCPRDGLDKRGVGIGDKAVGGHGRRERDAGEPTRVTVCFTNLVEYLSFYRERRPGKSEMVQVKAGSCRFLVNDG